MAPENTPPHPQQETKQDTAHAPVGRLRTAAQRRAKLAEQARAEQEAVERHESGRGHRFQDSVLSHLTLKMGWFALAWAGLIVVLLLPTGPDLPLAAKQALAILVFAVIMWVTEAVSYAVSSIMILGLIAVMLAFAPPATGEGNTAMGTAASLKLALGGFASPAVALVAAALALAAAMQATGLHKRLALLVLRFAGEKTRNILIGAIVISIILAFFVPSATARGGAVVPILLGMVAAFGLQANSKLGALLIITAAQSISIWNIGIKTAAAQNQVAIGFIRDQMHTDVPWGQWFLWAAPWSALMSVALYFIMRWAIKPEVEEIRGGKEMIRQELAKLGPITGKEIRLIVVSVLLLLMWSTEDVLHPFDSTTTTLVAIGVLLTPRIGVFSWKTVEKLINWGTLIVFAVGISLGSLLLSTGAAAWLSERTFGALGLAHMPILAMIAIVTAFTILIHLGFASATSLSSALIPVFIALAMSIPNAAQGGLGFVIIQQFVISFGFLLPVSAPQNMLAYGTGAFTAKQFLKVGIPLTIVGYLLIMLFSATYWSWLGLV
ncbi:DASS family sodium-coupled anion symporter [Brevibacterium rongguiense]|nr:DASS family sodium-coupled anion symporter [Brevibacterium rongguiense]